MADLDIAVVKPNLSSTTGPSRLELGALARIRRIDARGPERSVALGIGTAPHPVSGLETGTYEICLLLPSGEMQTRIVELGNEPAKVRFELTSDSSDVLAWQELGGATPGARAPPPQPDMIYKLATALDGANYGFASVRSADPVETLDDINLLTVEVQPTNEAETIDPNKIVDVWELLARGVRGAVRPAEMVKGFVRRRVRPDDEDELHDSWQFSLRADYLPGKRPARTYAVVRGDGVHELVSLPSPWRIDLGGPGDASESIVDLLVDKSAETRGARSSVAVRDAEFGGLVAFMNSGEIGVAGEMLRALPNLEEVAVRMLSEKAKSPLGACAAAYVLLATGDWTQEAGSTGPGWRQWVYNLDAQPLYNWIPDAAILCARMTLQQARTAEEANGAIPFLHRALRNGLPFYSLGYRWLLEAMSFCRRDPLIEAAYADVDRVGRYVDIGQTFVALQLEPPR